MSVCGIWACRGSALRGSLSKGCHPVFTRVLEKTTENSEQLALQERPGIVPGTSNLPALRNQKSSATGGALPREINTDKYRSKTEHDFEVFNISMDCLFNF